MTNEGIHHRATGSLRTSSHHNAVVVDQGSGGVANGLRTQPRVRRKKIKTKTTTRHGGLNVPLLLLAIAMVSFAASFLAFWSARFVFFATPSSRNVPSGRIAGGLSPQQQMDLLQQRQSSPDGLRFPQREQHVHFKATEREYDLTADEELIGAEELTDNGKGDGHEQQVQLQRAIQKHMLEVNHVDRDSRTQNRALRFGEQQHVNENNENSDIDNKDNDNEKTGVRYGYKKLNDKARHARDQLKKMRQVRRERLAKAFEQRQELVEGRDGTKRQAWNPSDYLEPHDENPHEDMRMGQRFRLSRRGNTAHRNETVWKQFKTMPDQLTTPYTTDSTVVPFVIMVFKRVEYLIQVMDSIRSSDVPIRQVPIVISHDGRVPDMVDYVESLKDDFDITQIFHPYSCYEHPDSFPGNDTSLNLGYGGDTYGHLRSGWATCCKHHFSWMINQVFELKELRPFDTFFFLEEDYIVSKNIYKSIITGMNVMVETENKTRNGYFGMTMDSTNGVKPWTDRYLSSTQEFKWAIKDFRTGPMTMNRNVWALLHNHSKEYCSGYDEYNWDWTVFHMMSDQYLPISTLVPYRTPLVQHVGVIGMHTSEHITFRDLKKRGLGVLKKRFLDFDEFLASNFTASSILSKPSPLSSRRRRNTHKESGGWKHPKDREHCQMLFGE